MPASSTSPTSPSTVAKNFDNLDKAAKDSQSILEYFDVVKPRHCVKNVFDVTIDDLAIFTAFSSNHVNEAMR